VRGGHLFLLQGPLGYRPRIQSPMLLMSGRDSMMAKQRPEIRGVIADIGACWSPFYQRMHSKHRLASH
jgi:hypothetical protein